MILFVVLFICIGTQMLKDVVEHCKACSKVEDSYQSFKKYVLTSSPSRTLYILEVHTLVYFGFNFILCMITFFGFCT